MATTKATVRRILPVIPQGRIGNKNILNRRPRNIPLKIKKVLPQTKKVEVKKNDAVFRRMNVRRKSIYIS